MALPPGPPVPGVLQTLVFSFRPFELFDWCARRYGDVFTLRMPGFGDFVMVSDPELIKQIFNGDPEQLKAGQANRPILEPVVGSHSVLVLDGQQHLRQRRLMLPPFHGERMRAYARLMAEIASAHIDRMPVGQPFALHPLMQSITVQVILRAVFGLDEGAQMDRLAELLVDFSRPPPAALMFIPPRLLPLTDVPFSPYRTFMQRRDRVDAALFEVIRTRRQKHDAGRQDILSLLMSARDEAGEALSDQELRDELVTMLLAGHETTATALSWAFAFLLLHPTVYERLEAELHGLCGADGRLDLAGVASAEYLDAVIKESLRLRPILPDVVRRVETPVRLGPHAIPAGAYLTPCIYLAQRRPGSWTDPERFSPERFLGVRLDPYTWFPFGGGIRKCLGMAFALSELKIVLAMTVLRTRLRLATANPLKVARRGVTLAPAEGTPVVLEARRPDLL